MVQQLQDKLEDSCSTTAGEEEAESMMKTINPLVFKFQQELQSLMLKFRALYEFKETFKEKFTRIFGSFETKFEVDTSVK